MDILNFKKSKIKRDLLQLFFAHPEKRYYLREMERILERPAAYIRRELIKLEQEGLFLSEYVGKERFFWLNQNFFLFQEIKGIVNKTIGIEGRLKQIIKHSKKISEAYVFGSYANDSLTPESDIDLLLISSAVELGVRNQIYKLQKEFGREINIVDMDDEEFAKRKKTKDEFIMNIFSNKIIKLV